MAPFRSFALNTIPSRVSSPWLVTFPAIDDGRRVKAWCPERDVSGPSEEPGAGGSPRPSRVEDCVIATVRRGLHEVTVERRYT